MYKNGCLALSMDEEGFVHVSGLFILDFIIIVIVFVKNSVFLSDSFILCSPLAIHASFVISRV